MPNSPDEFRFEPPSNPPQEIDEFYLQIDDGDEDVLSLEDDDGTTVENFEQERFLSWHQGRHVAMFQQDIRSKTWVIANAELMLPLAQSLSRLHPAVRKKAEIFLWDEESKMHRHEPTINLK